MLNQKDIILKLEELERYNFEHDKKIKLIFEYLKQFEQVKKQESEQKKRHRIGFKSN